MADFLMAISNLDTLDQYFSSWASLVVVDSCNHTLVASLAELYHNMEDHSNLEVVDYYSYPYSEDAFGSHTLEVDSYCPCLVYYQSIDCRLDT